MTSWRALAGLHSALVSGTRLAMVAGLAALLAFLTVDLLMNTIGCHVGAPNAGRRATMLVVTVLSASAAAGAAGATIGRFLGAQK